MPDPPPRLGEEFPVGASQSRQTIGDGLEGGLDKFGDDIKLAILRVWSDMQEYVEKHDIRFSADKGGIRIGLEVKR